ncbi:hypothetical protein ACFSRY_10105 [Pontibacter locisalis]|uniref:Uncharacterized protein n=1 Tax=Pontibacter locisalis TaxID=1719035 RepID=A0ABW5IQC6_9BACT
MKKLSLYLLPLLLALSAMVAVNEYARGTVSSAGLKGQTKMNSAVATPDACTWNCYNDTGYCKRHHVKLVSGYFGFIDPLYFGMIRALMSTGDYGVANLLFLVALWPMLMSYLLIKPLLIQLQINKLKKRHG